MITDGVLALHFIEILLDTAPPLWYTMRMKSIEYYDSSYSPNEACEDTNVPECGACYDGGYIDEDESVYCDCSQGDYHMDMDAEVEAEMRAEEEAERCATDYAYAVDSQYQDPRAEW